MFSSLEKQKRLEDQLLESFAPIGSNPFIEDGPVRVTATFGVHGGADDVIRH